MRSIMFRLMVSNLVVFSTTVPEMLGCVCCHRKERKKKILVYVAFPKHPPASLTAEPVRSVGNHFSSATLFCLRCKTLSAETLEPSPHLQALTAITTQNPKLRWCSAFPHERMSSNTACIFVSPPF